jgi:hypothetical protein
MAAAQPPVRNNSAINEHVEFSVSYLICDLISIEIEKE